MKTYIARGVKKGFRNGKSYTENFEFEFTGDSTAVRMIQHAFLNAFPAEDASDEEFEYIVHITEK